MLVLRGKVGNNSGLVYIIYFDLLRQSSYFFSLRLFYHGGILTNKKGLDKIFWKKKLSLIKETGEILFFFKKRD